MPATVQLPPPPPRSSLLGRRSPVVVHCAFLLPLPTCQRLKNCYISELHQELLAENHGDILYPKEDQFLGYSFKKLQIKPELLAVVRIAIE